MWIPMFIWLIIGCTHMNAQQVQMTLYRGSLAYMNGGGCSLMNDQKIKNDPFWGCLIGCAKNVSCQFALIYLKAHPSCFYCERSIIKPPPDRSIDYIYIGWKSYSNTTSPESMCPYIMKSIDTTTTGKTTKKSSISTTTAKKTTIRQPLCEQDWQPSNRSKGLWCMQMISFSGAEMSRSAALSICKEKRAIISGLETQSDIDIVKKSTQRIFSSFQDQSKGWGVWIGGQRLNGSQSFKFNDPYFTRKGYDYYKGPLNEYNKKLGNNVCLRLMVTKNSSDPRFGRVEEFNCSTLTSYGLLMRRVVCGKPAV